MIRHGLRATVSIVALVVSILVVGPQLAVAGKRCTYPAQECLDHIVEKYRKRGWMGVEIEMNEETGIIEITHVHGGAPAEKAGLRAGDIILEADGIPLTPEKLMQSKEMDEKLKPGATIVFTIKRCEAEPFKAAITLIRTPDFIVAGYLGKHMLEHSDFDAGPKAEH